MKIAIFGASGFSREVADICFASGYKKIVFIDKSADINKYSEFEIVDESYVETLSANGFNFIIGIGDNQIRNSIFYRFNKLSYPNIIHPSASFGLGQREYIEEHIGNIIAAGVRFTNGIKVGNFGIYNLNSTIGHDCIIGDYVNICPGVNISGNVTICKESFIGTNASIIHGQSMTNRVTVGERSTVAAGAVVVRDVPDGVTVMGVPAKVVK
jgi:sugar O-acyltransferase (sialic acid O-acetyltransferase NeuD family)